MFWVTLKEQLIRTGETVLSNSLFKFVLILTSLYYFDRKCKYYLYTLKGGAYILECNQIIYL